MLDLMNENRKSHLSLSLSSDIMLGPDKLEGVANFSTFLLDQSTGTLFLGARDAILAVDINKLNQKPRKVEEMCVCVCVYWVGPQ